MNRKNKWHLPVIVIVALTAIFLLNYFNSKKPPAEQIQQLISQHRAAIIFVKSNTEKDTEFLDALKEARHKMRGKGRIVFADEDFLKASEFQSDAGLGGVRGKESAFPRGVTGSDSDRQRGVSPYESNPVRDYLEGNEQPPIFIVIDAHGNIIGMLTAPLDRKMFEEIVHSIATHSH